MSQSAAPKGGSARACKILVANGVNLDLLGQRESQHYGRFTLAQLHRELHRYSEALATLYPQLAITLELFQSNDEAEFLAKLAEPWDGALCNFAAWTHTSLAIADRLAALGRPYVELHISNTAAREPFRHSSYCAAKAAGVVFGFGIASYHAALAGLLETLSRKNSD